MHTDNTTPTATPTGLLGNKEAQHAIRKHWRNFTKTHPKEQKAYELCAYHFLRFGHADRCFTAITNAVKLKNNYNDNPMATAQAHKRQMEYALRVYRKSTLPATKEFMSHIWPQELLRPYLEELEQLVLNWTPTASEKPLVKRTAVVLGAPA